MLRYDSKCRLSAGELLKHPFLTKKPSDFKRMDMVPAQKKPNSDFKKNKSIWAIDEFNKLCSEYSINLIPDEIKTVFTCFDPSRSFSKKFLLFILNLKYRNN